MADFIAPSGAQVSIKPAGFVESIALKNAVFEAAANSGLKIDFKNLKSIGADTDIDIMQIIEALISVDVSDRVNSALWRCLIKSTYNGQQITLSTFEEPKAREDYYPIIIACIKETILPFINGLLSQFSMISMFKQLLTPKSE